MGWTFTCPDWEDRLRSGLSLIPDLPLFREESDKAVAVFDRLRLPDVPGKPPLGEAGGEWMRDIVRAVFGSLDGHGVRHVPELFALVPKKNAKTTSGAAIMVTALIRNRRPNAEFILVGPTQEVADLAFQQASGMIEADPDGVLQNLFHVRDHLKTIEHRKNGSVLKIKTFDMKVMTGAKPTGVLVDELHVMSSMSYASRVIGQIRGGLDPRPEGFLIFITTQSDEPPAGAFKAELQLARGIRDGRVTGEAAIMLPVLYEFPESMQTDKSRPWANPAVWPWVLPNIGRSITIERLRKTFAGASEKGEQEIRRWASQHLNIEIGMGLHAERWRGADFWEAAAEQSLSLDDLLRRSEVVTVGVDGGGLDDLLGLAVIGREKGSRRWLHWGHAWADRGVKSLRKEIASRLEDFERDGDLTFCDISRSEGEEPAAAGEDIAGVVAICRKIFEADLFPEKDAIGLDPAGVAAIVDALVEAGIPSDLIVGVPQGYKLSGIITGVARKLADRSFRHAGQPLLAWCVSNAKPELRGSALLITKQASGWAKIDPLAALFNAADLMARNPESAVSSGSVMVI